MYKFDFVDTFNYKPIIFEIDKLDRELVKKTLRLYQVNHLYEIDNANYFAIWNCSAHGSEYYSVLLNKLSSQLNIDVYSCAMAIPFAPFCIHPNENDWISVEEAGLPDKKDNYLVVIKMKYYWQKEYEYHVDYATNDEFGVKGFWDLTSAVSYS